MKQTIKGKELKQNDGGESPKRCPNCSKLLNYHISGEGRYFCKYCGKKYEFTGEHFVRVHGPSEFFKSTGFMTKKFRERLSNFMEET